MTRSLRQWHRRLITALAVALLVLFIAALVARQPTPVNSHLPDASQLPNR